MIRSALVLVSITSVAFGSTPPPTNSKPPAQQIGAKAFRPFTGKVTANKVRMRIKPDLDSHIVRQANKNDLFLVVAEEGEFFAIEPPKDIKGYVFRSYILDDIVEVSKVNVRLEPNQDAPIIGQLEAGMKVQSHVCPSNHKWLEIGAPKGTHFYVSKEFLVSVGGPEYIANMEKRKTQAEELLHEALAQAEIESKKSYEDMSILPVVEQFQTLLHAYSDFPEIVTLAKEKLSALKETFLNKKIAFLETKAELSPKAREELLAKHKEESRDLSVDTAEQSHPGWLKKTAKKESSSDYRFWDTLEESLYLSWTSFHSGKKMDEFYAEQMANAKVLTGVLEPYQDTVKEKPGNFLLRNENGPVAYLYSTHVDLEKLCDQEVSLLVSPRPNNHFAFPAYFVLSIE